jgi:PAS domain S-box-containing protein
MSQNVLVVEDNSITRKMMRVALESAGYGVFEAPDGKTAVRMAQTESPALILQDLLLPDIDGLDLVKELRRSMPESQIPILACTGLMSKLDEARTIQGGFTDYLFKPIEPSRLLQVVERYLAAPAAGAKKAKEQIKVLLVDDDAIELKLEMLVLEAEGFTVTTASDGKEAWEIAQRSRPDAVLTDLIMPNMNGFDLCMALRKDPKFAALPIVITSSTSPHIEQEDRKLAEKVGADAFVGRTPDLKEAVEALRDALKRRAHPKPTYDSQALTENYLQRLVGRLEQQTYHNGDLIRRAAEEKAQLAVVASITETLNRKLPLQAALDEALARILDAAGISVGAVYLVEPDGRLVLQSQIGTSESKLHELQDFFGHSDLLYRALKKRKSFKMPSPKINGNVARDLQKKINAQSLLIAPLVAGDEPQGIIVAFSSRSELGDEWIASVKTVTVQLAQAVLLARTLARVSESEQRFRELAENIREIFYVAGSEGRPIHYISPAYEQITGRKCAALYRDPLAWLDHIHPDDRPRVEQVFQSDPQHLDQEYRIVKPNGEVRWLHDRTFPVKDETGRVVRSVGIAEDITDRKRAEQKAQQNLERIRALHEIDVAIASTLDLSTRLKLLLEKIEVFLPIAAATTVRLLNPETGELVSLASRGLDDDEWKRQERTIYSGRALRVVKTRAPVAVRNIQLDSRTYNPGIFRRRGLVSYLGVPLIAKDEVLGVLGLYTDREHEFTQEEIEFLNTLAGQAALAIHNSQLYEKIDVSRKELELTNKYLERSLKQLSSLYTALTPLTPSESLREMLEGILDRLLEATGADAALIRVRDEKTGTYPFQGHRGFPDHYLRKVEQAPVGGAVDWVVKHGAPIVAGDIGAEPRFKGKVQLELGLRSCAMLPLKVYNETRGIIHLSSRTLGYFDEEQKDHLMAVARQMGIALENRELFDNLQASKDELEKANRVKNEFLSVMSHELRTPLSVVIGYTGLVRDGSLGAVSKQQKDALQKVLVRAGEQLEMINEIMQTTQLEAHAISASRESFDLRDFLDHLRSDYEIREAKKDVRLIWHYPAAAMPVVTDRSKVKQILHNLINNALKFTEKGTVAVSAHIVEQEVGQQATGNSEASLMKNSDPSPHVSRRQPVLSGVEGPLASKWIEFTVKDTGIGIAKEMQQSIFEKFHQGDSSETRLYGGVGLGLYIVKNFTELLGGKMKVESEPGKGSTFTVKIPVEN